jgi:hypothetical protein
MNKLMKRLRALWRRRQLDRDLEDEMAFHLAMSELRSGDRSTAQRRLGNTAALKETCRDLWAFAALEAWWQDFRIALRTLKNDPLVTATAVVALGLGIGANSTVFSIVSSALRFDRGVDHIERLVMLRPGQALANLDPASRAPTDFLNLRKEVKNHCKLGGISLFGGECERYARASGALLARADDPQWMDDGQAEAAVGTGIRAG